MQNLLHHFARGGDHSSLRWILLFSLMGADDEDVMVDNEISTHVECNQQQQLVGSTVLLKYIATNIRNDSQVGYFYLGSPYIQYSMGTLFLCSLRIYSMRTNKPINFTSRPMSPSAFTVFTAI